MNQRYDASFVIELEGPFRAIISIRERAASRRCVLRFPFSLLFFVAFCFESC